MTKVYGSTYATNITLTNYGSYNPVSLVGTIVQAGTAKAAVIGYGSPWTITNQGTIEAAKGQPQFGLGIRLSDGGLVVNAAGASILLGGAIEIYGGPGTVLNYGSLANVSIDPSASTYGSPQGSVTSGGTLVNEPGGVISIGIDVGAPGLFINEGTLVLNSYFSLISLASGVSATNTSSGTIVGEAYVSGTGVTLRNDGLVTGGLDFFSGGTLVDSGTITGLQPVSLGGSLSNLLVLDPGAALIPNSPATGYGLVAASGSATAFNRVELAAGSGGVGTFDGFGDPATFTNFSVFGVDAGANWVIPGHPTLTSNESLFDNGTLTFAGGTIEVVGGTIAIGNGASLDAIIDLEQAKTNNVVALGSGSTTVTSSIADGVIYAGSGASTILQSSRENLISGKLVIAGGSGSLFFSGFYGGFDTVYGGSGSATLLGNGNVPFPGSDLLIGGSAGGNLIVAGGGNSTLVAGGSGDTVLGTAGDDVLISSAAGNDTLVGARANSTIIGGGGPTTVFGGGEIDTNATVYATGSFVMQCGEENNDVLFETGNAAIFGGTGTNQYDFVYGVSGGTAFIFNFKVGQDHLNLFGYGANPIASQLVVNGAANLILRDGTSITLPGLSTVPANSIFTP